MSSTLAIDCKVRPNNMLSSRTGIYGMTSCVIRIPFNHTLSDEERMEVVHVLGKTRNVPKKYIQVYKTIQSINFSDVFRELPSLVTTGDRRYYIEQVIHFTTLKKAEMFIVENQLTPSIV